MVHEQADSGERVARGLRLGGRGGAKDHYGNDNQDKRVPKPLHMVARAGGELGAQRRDRLGGQLS